MNPSLIAALRNKNSTIVFFLARFRGKSSFPSFFYPNFPRIVPPGLSPDPECFACSVSRDAKFNRARLLHSQVTLTMQPVPTLFFDDSSSRSLPPVLFFLA